MRAVSLEKAKQKQMFRTAFKSADFNQMRIGPGCYDPAYKEIGMGYMTVSGHNQIKVSP
jgi:hypothetical protein